MWEESRGTGVRIFFADEANFRADAELRGKRAQQGEPALVDSTSPSYGEKTGYYSAVCLETGVVEWMDASAGSAGGNSNPGTSVAFLTQLKEKHPAWPWFRDGTVCAGDHVLARRDISNLQ